MRRSANHRRFSYGGRESELTDVVVWKFDVQTDPHNLRDSQVTAYVQCAARGDAFRALFARCPGAKVFGTGLPLAHGMAKAEIGRELGAGEVILVEAQA